MSREIKFRAWDKLARKMIPAHEYLAISDFGIHFEYQHPVENENDAIIPMQFTGLLDKNGKDVYEGDIIRETHRRGLTDVSSVTFNRGAFCIDNRYLHHMPISNLTPDIPAGLEIIGNIYENPELLEAKQ